MEGESILFFGFLFLAGGVVSLIYGYNLNNNMEAQWNAVFNSASVDPGTPWIIGGIIAAVFGLVLIIFALFNASTSDAKRCTTQDDESRQSAVSYCPNCGTKIGENTYFCTKCGKKVR